MEPRLMELLRHCDRNGEPDSVVHVVVLEGHSWRTFCSGGWAREDASQAAQAGDEVCEGCLRGLLVAQLERRERLGAEVVELHPIVDDQVEVLGELGPDDTLEVLGHLGDAPPDDFDQGAAHALAIVDSMTITTTGVLASPSKEEKRIAPRCGRERNHEPGCTCPREAA